MRFIYLMLIFIFSFSLFANLEVSYSPLNPVANESFEIAFTINTDKTADPFVSFDPYGLEVIGRRQEVSVQTQFVNGKISTVRKVKLIYEVVSERARTVRLSNIKAEVGDSVYEHKNLSIKISKTKKTAKDIFVQAEVDNLNPYVGEGIDVRYYLYMRKPLHSTEIKQFPKLNGFIKRFHTVKNNGETVKIGDRLYKRILQYSARLYPMKAGTLKIDALRLIIRFSQQSSNPFGSFGLALGRLREKTVSSDVLKIEVANLPAENVPPGFLGLIGKHQAKLDFTKTKFLINEPIEARLELTGPGALEKMTAPILFSSGALEDFDIKTDFVSVDEREGRKTFDYTYLARANTKVDKRELKIYYFNTQTKAYEFVSVTIPEITIGGGGITKVSAKPNKTQKSSSKSQQAIEEKNQRSIVAPIFNHSLFSYIKNDYRLLSQITFGLLLILLIEMILYTSKITADNREFRLVIKKLRKKGLNYGDLSRLLLLIDQTKTDPREIVNKSNLSNKSKQYFLDCLKKLEHSVFSDGDGTSSKIEFRKSAFKELGAILGNESL